MNQRTFKIVIKYSIPSNVKTVIIYIFVITSQDVITVFDQSIYVIEVIVSSTNN